MAQSLQNESSSPAYLDYFGMMQPPFGALPEPAPMFLLEQHSLLMEHLSNATEQSDRILLMCGAPGSGKTTLLNQYISGLGDEAWFATLDDSCTNATSFYCEILEQLGFPEISGELHELRNITREFLVHRCKVEDNVLLLIDNAHRLRPTIYAQLRWISDITDQGRRAISVVLSGSPDLPKILESEAMKSICFIDRTDFTIRTFSDEETHNYIAHRLKMAGGSDAAQFSAQAKPLIYSYSGGIPELINTICNDVLSEAHARGTRVISEGLVHDVAKANQISQNSCPSINRGRRKSDVRRQQVESGKGAPGHEMVDTPAMERQLPSKSSGTKVDRNRLIRDIVERDDTIADLEDRLARSESKSEPELVRSELASREEELSDLIEHVAQMETSIEAAETDQREQRKESAKLKRQITALKKRAEKNPDLGSGEDGGIKQDLSESSKALKKAQREAAKNAKDLQRAQGAKKRVDGQLAKAKKKIEELDKWRKELQESVRQLTKEPRQTTEKEGECAVLEEKVSALEQDLLKKDKDAATLDRKLRRKDKRIEDLLSKLELSTVGEVQAQPTPPKTSNGTNYSRENGAADVDSVTKKSIRPISELEVFRGSKKMLAMKIADDVSRVMIGRSEDCELRLDSNFVSRHHAIISFGPDGARIEDLNSFNGTIVNSSSVSKRDLNPKDVIIIGDFLVKPRYS